MKNRTTASRARTALSGLRRRIFEVVDDLLSSIANGCEEKPVDRERARIARKVLDLVKPR